METKKQGDVIKVKKFRNHVVTSFKRFTALRKSIEELSVAKNEAEKKLWEFLNEVYPETKDRHCTMEIYGKGLKKAKITFLDRPKFGSMATPVDKDLDTSAK